LEYVEIRQQGIMYFSKLWNWVDIVNYAVFLVFFLMRKDLFPGVESGNDKFLPVSFMGLTNDDDQIILPKSSDTCI